jgi:putative hydrolase of the HAD superfamily
VPFKAIGFDYLGVTAQLPAISIFDVISGLTAIPADAVRGAYQRHNSDFQTGKITRQELWTTIAHEIGASHLTSIIIEHADADLPIVDTVMLELVDAIKDAGYRVGLLSNLATGTPWDMALRQAGVDKHFDVVILSGDVKLAKPDPDLYRLFAARIGVELNELIFIDDRQTSLEGVEELGIMPILFTDRAELVEQLRRYNIVY